MASKKELPYLGSPTANLSLSDPRCNNDSCKAFYDGSAHSQVLADYYYQYVYGHWTVYYYVAFVALFTSIYLARRFGKGSLGTTSVVSKVISKAQGGWRFIMYRRLSGRLERILYLPSFGMLLFFGAAILFCLLISLVDHPWYRERRGFGTSPLGVRTGLIAVALTPLLIALPGKANIITILTGYGHEKLNIIHRWVAFGTFIISMVHTIAHYLETEVNHAGFAGLQKQFRKHNAFEYTGIPPLAILFGLVVFSIPWIRSHVYELFYPLHIMLAITYIGLMFWHCANSGDSWTYLWVTIGIWLASILVRITWYVQPTKVTASRWFVGENVTATALPNGMTRLQMQPPKGFHWTPGQHCYVRIPKVSLWDNHPFTPACSEKRNALATKDDNAAVIDSSSISFFIRTRAGFTKRLRSHLAHNPDAELKAWLDGPYGGLHHDAGSVYDNVLIYIGGGGISFGLSWLDHFVSHPSSQTTLVRLVWSVRYMSSVSWIADSLRSYKPSQSSVRLEVFIHVTRDESEVEEKTNGNDKAVVSAAELPHTEFDSQNTSPDLNVTIANGRTNLNNLADDLKRGTRTLVLGCGPLTFKTDLSNACARAQSKVLSGELAEVKLETETFDW